MQWLVDLVIAAIGIPPVFIDRGTAAFYDWTQVELAPTAAWKVIDLSGIVPAGASAVCLGIKVKNTAAGSRFQMGNNDYVDNYNLNQLSCPVANQLVAGTFTVAVGSSRNVRYKGVLGVWTVVYVTVLGWWL